MRILIVTSNYRMFSDFANIFYEVLKPIVGKKENLKKVSIKKDLQGRVDKYTKVIFLEDKYLLKELYDIEDELKRRGCEFLDFHTRADNSEKLKNYLLKPINP